MKKDRAQSDSNVNSVSGNQDNTSTTSGLSNTGTDNVGATVNPGTYVHMFLYMFT